LDRLAAFEPVTYPVISLYLSTRPDQHGHANFDSFVRKEFRSRAKTYLPNSPEGDSFNRDIGRIDSYLKEKLRPSAHGLALFACAGADNFFDDVQLDAPIEEHQLYVDNRPHLYPLARVGDQYPPYAALLADTNSARMFVFGLGDVLEKVDVNNPKVRRTSMGGWSQARYQRHVENFHVHHAKEVIDALDRLVRDEKIERIVLAGDEVIIPLLRDQLPSHLSAKVMDILHLDMKTPEHDVMRATLEAMREVDAKTDAEKAARLVDQFRAGGLAVAGPRETLTALQNGQVDELLLSASVKELHGDGDSGPQEADTDSTIAAETLVTQARQTGARVTFIEDTALLAGVGGAGAFLRYRIGPTQKKETTQ
jgi:peptide chain release factor subunit 1